MPGGKAVPLTFDVEPGFRCTPRKWDQILISAYERGLRARRGADSARLPLAGQAGAAKR